MKVDFDDIHGMDFQAETRIAAAELFERAAENVGGDTAATVLRTTAEGLRTEAAAWEQAAELRRAIPEVDAVRPYLSQNKGSETALPALDETIVRTKERIKELLAPHLNRHGETRRKLTNEGGQ